MEDYPEIFDNVYMSVNIPWDADSLDEHTYYFWRLNPPINNMTHDTYTRETKEDGSFALIPEVREPKKTPD
ncbi:hypothetical protein SDC9_152607 [bioreactor metagenome]|uniref:Uncharacterized protein n=1 Tax=bioreactor metagenome TaxID=1076179 RepID=A0A645EU30_9ZZZZ